MSIDQSDASARAGTLPSGNSTVAAHAAENFVQIVGCNGEDMENLATQERDDG